MNKEIRELLRRYSCQAIIFQDEIAHALNLNPNDMKCYNLLNSYGAMSPSELASQSGLTNSAVTKILDRLKSHDAIRRVTGKDRRSLIIELNFPQGDVFSNRPDIDFDEYVDILTSQYNDTEIEIIKDFLANGADAMRTLTTSVREKHTEEK